MTKSVMLLTLLGGVIRFYLANTDVGLSVRNRVEVATPLNSFKRAQEGIYLLRENINPYNGDVVHEIPLILKALGVLNTIPNAGAFIYTILDLFTAVVLYLMSQHFVRWKFMKQKADLSLFAPQTEELQVQIVDIDNIPRFVLLVYLFNPLAILNCIGLTSTILSNLLLALVFFFLCKKKMLPCLLCLAIETMRNLYPAVLIAPAVIIFGRRSILGAVKVITIFFSLCAGVTWLNYLIIKDWNFLDGTLGFIFFYRDLQPNVGLFWYFFTEMFDHFRTMFLTTFQMNATVLYLLPLSLKFRNEPMLLSTVLVALMSIFRSYPCLGDVSFYLALLPLWRRCWKFMAHNFVVVGFFLVTLFMMPALWHLWIYNGSANANFYFGTTLAFSTGQIFLVTDLLFAHVKREFCLYNGQKLYVDGKEARIILE